MLASAPTGGRPASVISATDRRTLSGSVTSTREPDAGHVELLAQALLGALDPALVDVEQGHRPAFLGVAAGGGESDPAGRGCPADDGGPLSYSGLVAHLSVVLSFWLGSVTFD